jgi:hypothetical protein
MRGQRGGDSVTKKPATPARRSYCKRPVTVAELKIVPMPERGQAQAVAVLARWFAELLNADDFRAKVEERARRNHRNDCTLARPLLLQK